jgi:hypothetical protein
MNLALVLSLLKDTASVPGRAKGAWRQVLDRKTESSPERFAVRSVTAIGPNNLKQPQPSRWRHAPLCQLQ